ncbi:hypothetical protein [Mycobacterium sp. 1164985.4]|uniref:hypothetical protein n=1 Tax=Mycobacterium sp. 1164985.4 TaxID=1834069 RepID=UPI001E5B52F5|nr:hypothetical protein [Mycobacterium sp. 1164985.4]
MDRRVPMVAAIAFAVLYALALLIVPALPGIDRPGLDIVTHLNEHSGAMRTQALLLAFGSLALVVVLGHARDRLAGPYAFVFTIGSAVVLVQISIATWFTAGLSLHPGDLGSGTARAITDVVTMWGPILTVADIMVAAPILLAANEGRFPRWVGIVAAVFAVEQLIETITIIGPPGSFISPGGPMNLYLGGPLFILFFLALGVALSLPDTPPLTAGGEPASADAERVSEDADTTDGAEPEPE